MKNLVYLCLLITGCNLQMQETNNTISLEGEWKFRIDSLDVGITEKWFAHMPNQVVILPGSMTENGMGNEVTMATAWTGGIVDSSWFTADEFAKYRQPENLKIPFWLKPDKYYTGPAWYQKEVLIPEDWMDQKVVLHLERCHWESIVYVNDQKSGKQNSLAVPHEYDITALVKRGTNRISIRIDNRMIIPVGINSHSVSDHTQSNWNGIIGKIQLKATPNVSIKNVQIFPDIQSNTVKAVISIENSPGGPFEGTIGLQANSFNTDFLHTGPAYSEPIKLSGFEQVIEVVYPIGSDALQWSEFTPSLYKMEVQLSDDQGVEIDRHTEDFGMREFKAVGTRFHVNGHPLFLRGTLECCIFPLTGYPPMDLESWEYVMDRCKIHGLNHIRFHSWCPPEAAFAAADKHGVYLQIECGSWANQGSSLGDGSPLDSFIYQESDRILETYGNHPSFCMMAYGNEPAGTNLNQYLVEIMDHWRSKDQRRVYTAGAGWPILPENDFHNGPGPRIQHWGEGLGSIINAVPPQTMYDFGEIISGYHIPIVSHEIGQWCVYPDFKEIEKYTGVLKPTNFEIFQETLAAHHMGDQAEDFLMASGKLQALCYKAEIEAALRTPGFAGFQLLQLHDFPGQGTALVGILDPFFNSKGYITPEAFRTFCSQTVPLARMDKRTFKNSETFKAEIELAHFGEIPLINQNIVCKITNATGTTLHEVILQKGVVPVDNTIQVGNIEFALGQIENAAKITLQVFLEDTPFTNSWDFWVYPDELETESGEVMITNRLDQAATSMLEQGGSVLLLTSGRVNQEYGSQVEIGFSSIFWNTAWTMGQAPHTLGILCDPDHPVFNGFPTEYHSNWQWWEPIVHSQAMILDHLPGELRPLIQPIDTWFANRKLGLAFEAKAGNGKLMVCSIDLRQDIEKRPVSRQLLNSILDYMNSNEFNPQVEIHQDLVNEMLN